MPHVPAGVGYCTMADQLCTGEEPNTTVWAATAQGIACLLQVQEYEYMDQVPVSGTTTFKKKYVCGIISDYLRALHDIGTELDKILPR